MKHKDNEAVIRPKDRVHVDHGATVYTVQAISRVGPAAYVTDGEDTSIGTWVELGSLTLCDRTDAA